MNQVGMNQTCTLSFYVCGNFENTMQNTALNVENIFLGSRMLLHSASAFRVLHGPPNDVNTSQYSIEQEMYERGY